MSEKIYVLNENGGIKGLVSRDKVHTDGLLHAAVQCWVMDETGSVLIQRRAATKDKSAGKWDVSFGGHCTTTDNDENIMIANVIKEGQEELGLSFKPEEIIKLGEVRYVSQGGCNRELLGIFLVQVSHTQSFTFTDGEVSEIKWIKPLELEQNIRHNPDEYANRLGALTLLQFYKK